VGEIVFLDRLGDRADRALQPRGDPAVLDPLGARAGLGGAAGVHLGSRRGVVPRSPTRRARGPASTSSRAFIRISREAFHILLARSRPCRIRALEYRTSCVEDIASRPKRSASAPCSSISSSGSIPVPSDLLIRPPSGPWITEWTEPCANGLS